MCPRNGFINGTAHASLWPGRTLGLSPHMPGIHNAQNWTEPYRSEPIRNEYVGAADCRLSLCLCLRLHLHLSRRVALGYSCNSGSDWSLMVVRGREVEGRAGNDRSQKIMLLLACVFHLQSWRSLARSPARSSPGDSKIVKICCVARTAISQRSVSARALSLSLSSLFRSLVLSPSRCCDSLRGVCFYESRIRCFAWIRN